MRAVDTNVVVRLLVRNNPAQTAAADAFVAPGAWVSQLVLAATLWVLDAVYARSPAQCALAVDLLLQHRSLAIERPDVVAGAAGHTPVDTFDRGLARVGGAEQIRPAR